MNVRARIDALAEEREALTDLEWLRLECLKVAQDTAKLGLAHNVYSTAERYLAWVKGEVLPDPNSGLDFIQRLEALALEFLREERSDPEKIKNDVAEWFSNFEQRHQTPMFHTERPAADGGTDFVIGPTAEGVKELADIIMQHKDIRA